MGEVKNSSTRERPTAANRDLDNTRHNIDMQPTGDEVQLWNNEDRDT